MGKEASEELETKRLQVKRLGQDKNQTLIQLELPPKKSSVDLGFLKSEEKNGEDSIDALRCKVEVAEEGLQKMSEEHEKSTFVLSTKVTQLQNSLNAATDSNTLLTRRVRAASDELDTKESQLKKLEEQLGLNQEKDTSVAESFEVQEEALRAEVKKIEETAASLLAEKNRTAETLDQATKQNASLKAEQ